MSLSLSPLSLARAHTRAYALCVGVYVYACVHAQAFLFVNWLILGIPMRMHISVGATIATLRAYITAVPRHIKI
jgi:hypothetical protein